MVAALVLTACLPALLLPVVDAYQPVRVIGVAVAAFAVAAVASGRVVGRMAASAVALAGAYAALALLSAQVNGMSSAIYGVNGRFQGLVSLAALLAAGAAGMLGGDAVPRRSVVGAAVMAVLVAGFMALQPLLGAEPVATMGNRVIAGAWLAVVAALLAGSALLAYGRARLILSAAAVVAGLGVGLSGSRGAWLAVLAGGLVAVLATRPRGSRAPSLVAGLMAVALLSGALAGGAESLAKLDPSSLSGGSALSRTWIWRDTVTMIAERPVVGVGPGRFLYGYPRFESAEHASAEGYDRRTDQAHSLPLQTAAENGLLALGAATALVGLAVAGGVRAARRRDGVAIVALAGFSAYLVQGAFGVAAVEVDVFGWLLGGILIARGDRLSPSVDTVMGARLAAFARYSALSLAAVAAVASVVYLMADLAYSDSLQAFEAGDMAGAYAHAATAVRRAPTIDTYRVALADAASYGGGDVSFALSSLDDGLKREPSSHDLALSRARMLAATGAAPHVVADAYVVALETYPQAVSIRAEIASALRTAGRAAAAERLVMPVGSTAGEATGP